MATRVTAWRKAEGWMRLIVWMLSCVAGDVAECRNRELRRQRIDTRGRKLYAMCRKKGLRKAQPGLATRDADRRAPGARADQRQGTGVPVHCLPQAIGFLTGGTCIPGGRARGPAPGPTEAPLRSTRRSGRPNNHLARRVPCLYPGGRVVPVSRKPGTQRNSASRDERGPHRANRSLNCSYDGGGV